jgi:hypothetical protein
MAKPKDPNQQPKTMPDYESCGGIYIQPGEVNNI